MPPGGEALNIRSVPFDTLMEAGSLANCKTHGTLRLEGKDYVVKDGDVINFRVNA